MKISFDCHNYTKGEECIKIEYGFKGKYLSKPLSRILEFVKKEQCQSIVIEKPYFDVDFISEFSDYYSTILIPPSQRLCTRIHFFTKGNIKNVRDIQVSCSDKDYLGFTIIRPLEMRDIHKQIPLAQVGRTILRYPSENNKYILCKETYSVNIAGKRFYVTGMPFIQQDTNVGKCSHATLWMVSKYLSKKLGCQEFTINQITEITNPRKINGQLRPSTGLNDEQMIHCIVEMGYTPLYYNQIKIKEVTGFEIMEEIIYKYVESKLPVIINTKVAVGHQKIGHSFCVVGHNYDPKLKQLLNLRKRNYFTPISFIPSFIKHDDAEGLYIDINRDNINNADSVLIPLPSGIYLRGEEAERIAELYLHNRTILKMLFKAKEIMKTNQLFVSNSQLKESFYEFQKALDTNDLNFRTYLTTSNDFKERILKLDSEKGSSSELKEGVLDELMSKYVWVVEFCRNSALIGKEEKNRLINGEIVIDATSCVNQAGLILIHFPGLLIIIDPSQKKEDKIKWRLLPLDKKYQHLINF